MKKRNAWMVTSTDLFSKAKNPKGSWTPEDSKRNPQIEKRCLTCGSVLVYAAVYENGQEDESLYCLKCKEEKNVSAKEG